MRYSNMNMAPALAAIAAAAALVSPPASAECHVNASAFESASQRSGNGTVSRSEVQKMMERAFDKVDPDKKGLLGKDQFQLFLIELTRMSGA